MTPLLLLAGAALCAVFVGRLAFVALHRRRSPRHPSLWTPDRRWARSFTVDQDSNAVVWLGDWHEDPDGFVVEDTGLPRWDGSKGP